MVAPQLSIAGPTIEALKFAGAEESLREMYINLLESSMDAEICEKAHPSFVEIIRQMTPDEARIVQFFSKKQSFLVLEITLAPMPGERRTIRVIPEALTILGPEDDIRRILLISSYLDKLCRLRLAEHRGVSNIGDYVRDFSIAPYAEFQRIINKTGENTFINPYPNLGKENYARQGNILHVTDFGRLFCEACVR